MHHNNQHKVQTESQSHVNDLTAHEWNGTCFKPQVRGYMVTYLPSYTLNIVKKSDQRLFKGLGDNFWAHKIQLCSRTELFLVENHLLLLSTDHNCYYLSTWESHKFVFVFCCPVQLIHSWIMVCFLKFFSPKVTWLRKWNNCEALNMTVSTVYILYRKTIALQISLSRGGSLTVTGKRPSLVNGAYKKVFSSALFIFYCFTTLNHSGFIKATMCNIWKCPTSFPWPCLESYFSLADFSLYFTAFI